MMIDRPTWSQFYYWCGTEIWLIYCSSTNHCFTIVYCFIPYLTRRKWGLRKYWSLQSIQWYLYTNRVLATFFPCCNLSSRAVEDEPDEDTCIWKKKQQSTHQLVSRLCARASVIWFSSHWLDKISFRSAPPTDICCLYSQVMLSMHKTSCMSFQQGDFSRLSSLVVEETSSLC